MKFAYYITDLINKKCIISKNFFLNLKFVIYKSKIMKC